jgi:hypothetical protein
MKRLSKLFLVVSAILIVVNSTLAQTTSFTYQGKLTDGSNPASGTYDFQFALFDSLSGGTQIGSTLTLAGTSVTGGAFTVQLDFGVNAFPGANRFLETSVRPAGGGAFTVLTPRQRITSTPYAIRSTTSTSADNAAQLGGVTASQYVQTNDSRLSDPRSPTPGSSNYIQNTASLQTNTNFNISGNGIVNGRIGVGTNSPVSKLDVRGNMSIGVQNLPGGIFGANSLFVNNDDGGDPNNYFRIDGSGDNLYIVAASQPGATSGAGITFRTGAAGTTEADRVHINRFGLVGINTNNPTYFLDVHGTNTGLSCGPAVIRWGDPFVQSCSHALTLITSDANFDLLGGLDPNGNVVVRMRSNGDILTEGILGVGTLSPQRTLHVNGRARIGSIPLEASGASVCFNAAGDLLQCGASSLRLKTNVTQFRGGLDIIRRLKPISFDWKDGSGRDIGLGAEDVAKVAPSLTLTNSQGEVAGVKYERFNVILINAVKDQQAQIEKQQAMIASLQKTNSALNARLQKVERSLRKGISSSPRRH